MPEFNRKIIDANSENISVIFQRIETIQDILENIKSADLESQKNAKSVFDDLEKIRVLVGRMSLENSSLKTEISTIRSELTAINEAISEIDKKIIDSEATESKDRWILHFLKGADVDENN